MFFLQGRKFSDVAEQIADIVNKIATGKTSHDRNKLMSTALSTERKVVEFFLDLWKGEEEKNADFIGLLASTELRQQLEKVRHILTMDAIQIGFWEVSLMDPRTVDGL